MERPLDRLRVIDLGESIAGQYCARVDLWRHHRQLHRPWLYADGDGGARPSNRNALFNSQNIKKRSLRLDLRSPRGWQLALEPGTAVRRMAGRPVQISMR